ncbi:unnamed protein product [Closterium sp. NIES-54]
MDCGVDLSTDPETRNILLHYTAPNKAHKHIGQGHSENGVYILDSDIPDCSGDSQELIDLVPLRFEHIHRSDWKHPDGRPWVLHHPHPRELALHNPDPDGICRDCHTPTASTSAIAGSGLAAIAEAERLAPPEEGMSTLELEIATCGIFGTEEHPLPRPASQHLSGMLRSISVGTFDVHRVPRPYTKENFIEIYYHLRESTKKLTVAQEEKLAQREAEELRQRSLAESCGTFAWSGWEEEESSFNEGGTRALYAHLGFHANDDLWHQRLGHPLRVTLKNCIEAGVFAPGALLRLDGTKVSSTTQPRNCTFYPEAALSNQPFPLLEPGTNRYPKLHKVYSDFLNVGHCGINKELYTLTFVDIGTRYVWIVNMEARSRAYGVFRLWLAHAQWQFGEKLKIWRSDGAAEFRSKELQDYLAQKGIEHHISLPYAHPRICRETTKALRGPRSSTRALYAHLGFHANDDLWHQRLGHPLRVTLKNCIEASVFAPGALLRLDGTKVSSTTQPRNCTFYPEAALSNQPFPLLEPGTNRYPKLHKVYSDFLNVGHCGINKELYTLTFVDIGTRYVWIVNMEARSRAYGVFRLWLAHAQWQFGEKLKIWRSDGAAEFRSKELQDYLAQKGIEHHISLPYAHQQQGVAERTNRTLVTKLRALMKQSKLPPTYRTYAMHHAVRVQNLLSTTAITGNLSPHLKSQTRAVSSSTGRLFLKQFHEDEQMNANRVYANDGHSYASPEDEAGAAILEQDTRGEFTGGDRHDGDDDDDNSSGGGVGAAGGSDRSAAPPAPPEPESDDDEVQENLRQALTKPHSKEWREAMDAKIKALESRKTWVLVDRAAIKGRRILYGKWVFRVKIAADGTIEQFKARWVMHGYNQRHGIDFDPTFVPVSCHTSVRILLAIAPARHLLLRQIDVKNVFLYALVDAVIYVEQPHTYCEGDSRVCQLRKSLYVINQVPRLWQQYLHNILLEIGFKQLPHDP